MGDKKSNSFIFKFVAISLITVCMITAMSHIAINIKAIDNYNKNVKIWEDYNHTGLIYDQWDFEKLHYGFGNIGANGCGAVSVYNVLYLENMDPDFPEIINKFDYGGENVFGLGGSKPSRVINVLKEYGFDVYYTLNPNKFEKMAKTHKYSIFLYFGIKGIDLFGHYQLLYNYDGEKFDTLNLTGKFKYEEIVNIPNTFFKMLIGIN